MLVKFLFEGQQGTIDPYGFIRYGNTGFQIEAAKNGLKTAIEAACKKANWIKK